jgi:Uma2 family endonuclease
MVAMSTAKEALLPFEGPIAVADLDRLPQDGHRWELLDGVLVVSPRPTNPHQVVATELLVLLHAHCPPELRVIPEPAVRLNDMTEFNPDIVVIRLDEAAEKKCTEPPPLVVEIRSPSTAVIDLNKKKAAYERFGAPSYWIVIPDRDKPELIAFELGKQGYEEAAHVTGDQAFTATRPFEVTVVPAQLVAGLPPPRDKG